MYQARRKKLIQSLPKNSVVVLATNKELQRNADVNFIFRQNSNFYYLTGFYEPNAIIILDNNYTIFMQDNNPKLEIWNGKMLAFKKAKQQLLVDKVFDIRQLKSKLKDLIKNKKVYFDFDNLSLDIVKILSTRPYQSLKQKIAKLRLIKDESEITKIKQAIKISAKAHIIAMQNVKKYKFEYQLRSVFDGLFSYYNVRHAYPAIVAAGKNALTLHYIQNNKKLKIKDLVLIDAGCEYHLYASDITRTFPICGIFSQAQKEIYNIVLEANKQAIASIKIGQSINTPHIVATKVIKQGLQSLGLLKNHKVADFFMHGTSHYLGLDVHDVGEYKIDGTYKNFEPGMVITIEPGIYINNDSNIVKKYHNIGIRIEDNILLKNNGIEILTKNIPKEVKVIEDLMQ